jgi:hypothetical protein
MQEAARTYARKSDEFGKGAFGGADEIIDKHYTRVHQLTSLFCNLRQFAAGDKPKGTEPLGRDDFRCFGCGHIIKLEDTQCQLCGWTWM